MEVPVEEPLGASPPLPVIDDPDTAGFWAAAARGGLAVCACKSCDAVLHLPRSVCDRCRSFDVEWRTVPPTGRLHSWTVAEMQVHPAFPVPYTTVLVALDIDPAVRFAGYLPGRPPLAAGMAMRAEFVPVEDEAGTVTLVQWVPAGPTP